MVNYQNASYQTRIGRTPINKFTLDLVNHEIIKHYGGQDGDRRHVSIISKDILVLRPFHWKFASHVGQYPRPIGHAVRRVGLQPRGNAERFPLLAMYTILFISITMSSEIERV